MDSEKVLCAGREQSGKGGSSGTKDNHRQDRFIGRDKRSYIEE